MNPNPEYVLLIWSAVVLMSVTLAVTGWSPSVKEAK